MEQDLDYYDKSNISFSNIDYPFDDNQQADDQQNNSGINKDNVYDFGLQPINEGLYQTVQTNSLRENIMEKLTNLRYRFNDGDLIKYMAYPEVDFSNSPSSDDNDTACLFNYKFNNQKDFNKAFKTIIWVSYRKNFLPLLRRIQ